MQQFQIAACYLVFCLSKIVGAKCAFKLEEMEYNPVIVLRTKHPVTFASHNLVACPDGECRVLRAVVKCFCGFKEIS